MTAHDDRLRAVAISVEPASLAARFNLGLILEVVGSGNSSKGVTNVVASRDPSVVVIDMGLPGDEVAATIREVRQSASSVGVIVAAERPLDHENVARALSAGAHALIVDGAEDSDVVAAVHAATQGQTWLPLDATRDMLALQGAEEDLTSVQRDARVRNLVIGLIPLTGAAAALISLLFRRYLGQVGVRPVDLAIDPTTRIADVLIALSIMVGLFGPLMFIGSWIDLIRNNERAPIAKWVSRHPRLAHLIGTLAVFSIAAFLAAFVQVLFALFVGPFVGALLVAKVLDLDDDLPAVLRISRLRPERAALAAAAAFILMLSAVSYEVLVRGPEFNTKGEVGWIAPGLLGFNAQPMRATVVDDGSTSEVLYLGGNADLYVLVDPCDDDRVDLVSVGSTKLTVIDEVHCDG